MTHETMGMSIGVAVSDSPTGPFKDALGKPLAHSGNGDIDPTGLFRLDGWNLKSAREQELTVP